MPSVTRICVLCGIAAMGLDWHVHAAGAQLPEGPGKTTVQKVCGGCHAPEIVLGRHETKESWERIVSDMVEKGANGTDDEFNQIIDYLAANFSREKNGTRATANYECHVTSAEGPLSQRMNN